MIYIEELLFEPGSEEWCKIAKFMNGRLELMFNTFISFRGIENLSNYKANDAELYTSVSEEVAPHTHSRIKANQTVLATYKLLKEDGYYVPDLDMRYVLYNIIENYKDCLRECTGGTVLKICEEERGAYLKCFQDLIEWGAYTEEDMCPEDEVRNLENLDYYYEIIFSDMDFLLYDQLSDRQIREAHMLKACGVENEFNESFSYTDPISGKEISYVGELGKKRKR